MITPDWKDFLIMPTRITYREKRDGMGRGLTCIGRVAQVGESMQLLGVGPVLAHVQECSLPG